MIEASRYIARASVIGHQLANPEEQARMCIVELGEVLLLPSAAFDWAPILRLERKRDSFRMHEAGGQEPSERAATGQKVSLGAYACGAAFSARRALWSRVLRARCLSFLKTGKQLDGPDRAGGVKSVQRVSRFVAPGQLPRCQGGPGPRRAVESLPGGLPGSPSPKELP